MIASLPDTLPRFSSVVVQQAQGAYGAFRLAAGSEGAPGWHDLTEAETEGWFAFAAACLRCPTESPEALAALGYSALCEHRWLKEEELDPARLRGYRAAAQALALSWTSLHNRSED